MTNEEKATKMLWGANTKGIYNVIDDVYYQLDFSEFSIEEALKEDLMQMAKWKDEQFASEKETLMNRIFQEFKFQNFTFVDIDGSLGFNYDKFCAFLEKASGVKIKD